MTVLPESLAYEAPADLRRWQRAALTLGIVGILASLLAAVTDSSQFGRAYLVSWVYWLSVTLGMLALLMLHHMTRGAWGLMIRRVLEAGTRTMLLVALLFVPIVWRLRDIFVWATDRGLEDPLIAHKTWFLNPEFFLARAVAYFVVWGLLVLFLNRLSLRQDRTGDPALFRRMQRIAGPGLGVLVVLGTVASVDWLMSVDPHWYSSLFGVYFVGGQAVAGMACAIVVVRYLATREPMDSAFKSQHFHDHGNLLMAFVLLWSYFALSQFLIIWSGNLAEETVWYLERQHGAWRWFSVSLVIFHFAVPFFLLLSRARKRQISRLARIALLLLLMRWVDLYWLTAPSWEGEHALPSWHYLATFVAVGGLWTAVFLSQLGRRSLLPIQDPFLEEALDA